MVPATAPKTYETIPSAIELAGMASLVAGESVNFVQDSASAERTFPRHQEDARVKIHETYPYLHTGARMERDPTDAFYGERSGVVRDPFGHRWNIGHSIEEVTPEEMQRRYPAAT